MKSEDGYLGFYGLSHYKPEKFEPAIPKVMKKHILVLPEWTEPSNFRLMECAERRALMGTLRDTSVTTFEYNLPWVWFGGYTTKRKHATYHEGSTIRPVARSLFEIAFGETPFIQGRRMYSIRKRMPRIMPVEGFYLSDVNPFHYMPAGLGHYRENVIGWMNRTYLPHSDASKADRFKKWVFENRMRYCFDDVFDGHVQCEDDTWVDNVLALVVREGKDFSREVIKELMDRYKALPNSRILDHLDF